jgi:hypothetical protein
VTDLAPHPVDTLQAEAAAAVTRMQDAARAARLLQARAELARHMRTTARKLLHLPLEEAVAAICREWMKAWGLKVDAWPGLAGPVGDFARAFCEDARGGTAATRAAIDQSLTALDNAFRALGSSLGDEMAFRSECAHGWWSAVVPVPEALVDPARALGIPKPLPGEPFWSAGPQAHCLPQPE